MTLVAAYRISDVPVLIGDFMISDNTPGAGHVFVPTMPHLYGVVPPSGWRIAGTRKKIHKINDRLVVGFTGYLAPGRILLRNLYERFCSHQGSFSAFRDYLANLIFPGMEYTELVGWHCDVRPHCFHWRGSQPDQLRPLQSAYAGSGAAHFRHDVLPAEPGTIRGIRSAFDQAIYQGLSDAGKILLQDLSGGKNVAESYGLGAELLVWNGSRFHYIEKVTSVFWNLILDLDNKLQLQMINCAVVYRSYETYSVLQVIEMEPSGTPNSYIDVITPIHDDMPDLHHRVVETIDSPLMFSAFNIFNPAKQLRCMCVLVSSREEDEAVAWTEGGAFKFNRRKIVEMLPSSFLN